MTVIQALSNRENSKAFEPRYTKPVQLMSTVPPFKKKISPDRADTDRGNQKNMSYGHGWYKM